VTMSFAPTFYPPNVATLQRAAAVEKSRQTPTSRNTWRASAGLRGRT
jgi:hypothetical protein